MKIDGQNMPPLRGLNLFGSSFYKDVAPKALKDSTTNVANETVTQKIIAEPARAVMKMFGMARIRLLVGIVAVLFGCSGCAETKSEKHSHVANTNCENFCFAGVVLLATENAHQGFLKNYYYPLWMPSTNVANEALSQISNYLQHAEYEPLGHPAYARELPGVRERLPKTVCQIVGVTCDRKKGILLNCFPVEGLWSEQWRDAFIKVCDGGPRYWSAVYLPDEHRFSNLEIDLGF
jgi:hypothetical protein